MKRRRNTLRSAGRLVGRSERRLVGRYWGQGACYQSSGGLFGLGRSVGNLTRPRNVRSGPIFTNRTYSIQTPRTTLTWPLVPVSAPSLGATRATEATPNAPTTAPAPRNSEFPTYLPPPGGPGASGEGPRVVSGVVSGVVSRGSKSEKFVFS